MNAGRALTMAGALACLAAGTTAAGGGRQAASPTCAVTVESPRLVLTGADRHARAEFVLSENCEPVLKTVAYSTRLPDAGRPAAPARAGLPPPSGGAVALPPPAKAAGAAAGHACTLDVWEVDVVEVAMVTVRNFTSWQTAGGEIASGRSEPFAFANLDWWFVDGKPSAQISYLKEPYTASGRASGAFYCEGARGLSKYVCSGASYRVRLDADVMFDGGGVCSGQGRATGTLVPLGGVRFELTRGPTQGLYH